MVFTEGSFRVVVEVDDDGHVTISIESTDGSKIIEVGDPQNDSETERIFRFTTQTIEDTYKAAL